MTCHPSEGDFHFLGVDDVKVFSSCRFFHVQVADVPFDFVDQILGQLGLITVQGFYRCLVVDAEIDAGACSIDQLGEVKT